MESIQVKLDEKIKSIDLFQKITDLSYEKEDIFKYGIMNIDVPEKICENDFTYIFGKIPAFEMMYDDHISIENGFLYNNSTGESKIKVSEMIGVGLGLKYATELLEVPITSFLKIPAPKKKLKYLDFHALTSIGKVKLECKGTTNTGSINSFLASIEAKKKDDDDINTTNIGTIAVVRKTRDINESYLYVTDDFNKYLNFPT